MEEKLQALKFFFENDMKIKEKLLELAPNEYDEEKRMKYIDKLDKYFETVEDKFLEISRNFDFSSEVKVSINKYFEKTRKNLLIDQYKSGICQEIYKKTLANMDIEIIEKVKQEFAGYTLKEDIDLAMIINYANTINELLHIMHSYITNNEKILQAMPIIDKKIIDENKEITLYGEHNEIAQKIFNEFSNKIKSQWVDIVALPNKVLMMARDLGHALTIDIDTSDLKDISIKYFIPKICNKEMVENLPGINKSSITESGAIGSFVSSKEEVEKNLYDFMKKVPTDWDEPNNLYNLFREEELRKIAMEAGKSGRRTGKLNSMVLNMKNFTKTKDENIK